MNPATAVLRQEHEAILRMLDATLVAAERLEQGKKVSPETLSGLLEFFRLFADRCHHGKEEELLFPLLEQKGLPAEGGPTGVMRSEHEQGRALIAEMAAAGEAYANGQMGAGQRWAAAAVDYADLLRQHIFKENNILFPMADRLLADVEQERLVAGFEQVEEQKMGIGTHERLHARMKELLSELSPAAD